MAEHTISGSPVTITETLSGSTVDTINVPSGSGTVAIVNISGSAIITVTVNGVAPVVAGTEAGEHQLPATTCRLVIPVTPNLASVVKLISSGTPEYKVSAGPNVLSGVDLEYLATA